jgi:type IX secretion system PorP/SprF family membrane protein
MWTFGQQDPQFTQFMFDKLSINPGYAGIGNELCVTGFYRQQWSGFDGAPTTTMINGHMPIRSINSGAGLTFYSDELGQEESTLIRGHFSYHLKNVGPGKLGLGVSLGYLSKSLGSNWVAIDPVSDDASIPDNSTSAGTFDLGFGAYYKSDRFYAGLSSTHLTEGDIKDMNVQTSRHYYLQAGYRHTLSPSFDLLPNILLKSDAASTQVDVNVMAMYKNSLWLGVSGRIDDAVAPMIGYRHEMANGLSAIRIGYSYDVTMSELKNYSSNSHEIMLNYCMKLKKPLPPQIYKNVRFL